MQAPWGEIRRAGARLDAGTTYSQIAAPSSGPNLFMGDVVALAVKSTAARFGMVLTHSCNVAKQPVVSVCPVLLESDLTAATLSGLRIKPVLPRNVPALQQMYLSNEAIQYAAFPAPPDDGAIKEPFVAALHLAQPMPTAAVSVLPPSYRLTYRALSFLQWRLGVLSGRDVENSDETRDF